jgi:hypothetical protein
MAFQNLGWFSIYVPILQLHVMTLQDAENEGELSLYFTTADLTEISAAVCRLEIFGSRTGRQPR